ncbi:MULTISPECIES: hypothetical protein [unclassified Streptomyces]|uniref:hypothetical protein n=1 Tax=unclassified Streptomyces TaxID=2593676 RepID=UPI0011CDD16A|nr:hypothetical protein [Streptomyces sp. I6]
MDVDVGGQYGHAVAGGINERAGSPVDGGEPVVGVDTGKKQPVGASRSTGQPWLPGAGLPADPLRLVEAITSPVRRSSSIGTAHR